MAVPIASIQQQVADPFMRAMQGFQQSQQQRVQEDALRIEQEKVQAKQQRQTEVRQAVADHYNNPNRTLEDTEKLMVMYPELKDALVEPYKNKTEAERSGVFRDLAENLTMLKSGNLELVESSIDKRIAGAENSNKPEDAELLRFQKDQLKENPEITKNVMLGQMYAIDPDRARKWVEGTEPKQEEPDITAKQNDYMFYRRQEQEAGREPLSFNEWDQQARAAGATKVSVGGEAPQATAYEKKIDQLAAAEMVDWTTQGRSQSKSNLSEFRRIQSDLESGKINTRTVGDFMPFVSDEVRKIFNEPAAEAVNDVRAIAFQVLRETLGAQFTEKEGERLIATYFDPQLSEKANIKRMERMANFTEQLIEDKDRLAAYMDKKRTAIGFQSIAPDKMQAIRDFVAEGTADTPMENSKGWQLMTDANGNQAYVGPNGEIEEVR
jgi:hypothetical protein